MSDLIIPDISEFQGTVDWKKLIDGGHPAAIVRVHNGNRVDHYFSANRTNAHAHGIKALGLYQYVLSGKDAATQASELAATLGALKPGEWVIADIESGSGDQSARAKAWHSTVMAKLHVTDHQTELYSGQSFFETRGLSKAGFSRIWVAAYSSHEPSSPAHELWQFTDAQSFPGIASKCDASRFHGTIDQLLGHVNPARPPVTSKPTVDQSNLIRAVHDYPKNPAADSVKVVQAALHAEGLYPGAVDGKAGPVTKAAYAKWQRRLGYTGTGADGVPGPTSLAKLAHARGFTVVA